MKENKFRAKSVKEDKWAYGNLFTGRTENGIPYAVILTDKGYKVGIEDKDTALAFRREEVEIVLPSTVCQYVGLKDKFGVEIYEGDVVSYDDKTGVVRWDAVRSLTGTQEPFDDYFHVFKYGSEFVKNKVIEEMNERRSKY